MTGLRPSRAISAAIASVSKNVGRPRRVGFHRAPEHEPLRGDVDGGSGTVLRAICRGRSTMGSSRLSLSLSAVRWASHCTHSARTCPKQTGCSSRTWDAGRVQRCRSAVAAAHVVAAMPHLQTHRPPRCGSTGTGGVNGPMQAGGLSADPPLSPVYHRARPRYTRRACRQATDALDLICPSNSPQDARSEWRSCRDAGDGRSQLRGPSVGGQAG